MLLREKYMPVTFEDSNFQEDTITKLKNIASIDTFHNLLLYGPGGSGKYTMAMMVLQQIYGNDVYNKSLMKFKFNINGNEKEIDIFNSIYHYEIYLSDNNSYDKLIIIELLKKLSETRNVISNGFSIVVIKNAHYLTDDIFNALKNINEKYYENCKFILLANTLTNVSRLQFGFFFFVRMPMVSATVLANHFQDLCKNEKIKITLPQINTIIKKNGHNLNRIYIEMDLMLQNGEYFVYTTEVVNKCDHIIELINTKNIANISAIRKELYNLTSINIDKGEFITYIFNYYITKIADKNNFITLSNEISVKINKSYRELIHLEYYLIAIMSIIAD